MILPGIFELARAEGISWLTDMNGDGNIDQTDLDMAIEAKATPEATIKGV